MRRHCLAGLRTRLALRSCQSAVGCSSSLVPGCFCADHLTLVLGALLQLRDGAAHRGVPAAEPASDCTGGGPATAGQRRPGGTAAHSAGAAR